MARSPKDNQRAHSTDIAVANVAKAIGEVALAVAGELDPKRAAHTVVEQTRRVLGADGVLLWEAVETGTRKRLRLLAYRGIPRPLLAQLRLISFRAPTLTSRAALTGKLQVQEDMRQAAPELSITRQLAETYGFRSMVAVPLSARGRLVGVMTYTTKTMRRFGAEQLETVMAIGRIFAVGLDNAKAYARERELRAELEALVSSSPEGILLLEAPSGRLLLANKATETMLARTMIPDLSIEDYASRYALLQPNGAHYPPNELPPARAFRGQTVLGVQMLIRQPSGRELPVLVNAAPVRDEQGAVVAAVVLFQDISRQKELERQRQEMSSIIAHDLRAPIAVIAGYIDLLLAKPEKYAVSDQAMRALRRVRDSASSLDRLVGDLLDVARLETGRITLRRNWIDLPALVRDIAGRMSPTMPRHPIEIRTEGEIPPVWADPGRVEQVFSNLLTNAAKYSELDTEIQITVRQREGGDVAVSVADRGYGIPPEEMPHIFERYYRVRPKAQGPEGLGLGLYITKRLVEALGGRIWVESEPGAGSIFHFTLPTTVKGRREAASRHGGEARVNKAVS